MLRNLSRRAVCITTALLAACANPRPELPAQPQTAAAPASHPTPAAVPADAPASHPVVVSAKAPASKPPALGIVAKRPSDRGAFFELPDGTFAPALNGVRDAPAMAWPKDLPFAPIVGKETHQGAEWYVHADGSKSTTSMVFRPDLGRDDPVTQVANPIKK